MIFDRKKVRILLLAPAALAFLAGTWAGLARMGWGLPLWEPRTVIGHGPLMISGFMGTLINLERAVASGKRWPYAGVLASGAGALLLVAGGNTLFGPVLVLLGSVSMLAVFVHWYRSHGGMHTLVMLLGAACWVTGNILWVMGWAVAHFVFWWLGFLVLTIAGERLELGRLLRLSRAAFWLFGAAVVLLLAGLGVTLQAQVQGVRLAGAGMLMLAAWLLRWDIARKTVRQSGLPRYTAVCLLSGYVWLGVGGVLAMGYEGATAGTAYDLLLHSVLLGFVMAMVFGHGPIILPAILKRPLDFTPVLYLPLGLLHAGLFARAWADLAGAADVRQWAGMINAAAILLYFAITAPKPRGRGAKEPVSQGETRLGS